MKKYEENESSEDYTSEEGSSEEYFDGAENDIEGGGYQLSSDYLDAMGMGTGGVLMGGAVNPWPKFYSKLAAKGYTRTQASELWQSGQKVASKIPPKQFTKTSKKGKTINCKKCPTNKKCYVRPGNYDMYCPATPTKRVTRSKPVKKVAPSKPRMTDNQLRLNCRKKGLYWCPITKRCRSYNDDKIPYEILKDGRPKVFYVKSRDGSLKPVSQMDFLALKKKKMM